MKVITKYWLFLGLIFLTISCQVSETIVINNDGSGSIKMDQLRDENFFQKVNAINKNSEPEQEIFKDTTFLFGDYISKHSKTFTNIPIADQKVFLRYKDVTVRIKKDSYNKEFRTTYTQDFKSAIDIVDLYKTSEYLSDVKNNYALAAEEHYYLVSYSFDGLVFKRIVQITSTDFFKKETDEINERIEVFKKFNPTEKYLLNYSFPRKIKSVSNPNATISADKKSLVLEFKLTECIKNPKISELEVVLEQ